MRFLLYREVREPKPDGRVQDGFIKAYYAMNSFDHQRDPFPWLAKIVINECKKTNSSQVGTVRFFMSTASLPKLSYFEE